MSIQMLRFRRDLSVLNVLWGLFDRKKILWSRCFLQDIVPALSCKSKPFYSITEKKKITQKRSIHTFNLTLESQKTVSLEI